MQLCLALALASLPGAGAPQADVTDFNLSDAAGKRHMAREWHKARAVALIFLGTECPVSNGYTPEYRRLSAAYAAKGVYFYGVHSDPDVTAAVASRHAANYRIAFPVLLDPTQKLARQAGVTVVPSAVVVTPAGRILYRGRVDDRYTPDGKRREEPRTHDLENVLQGLLGGKPLSFHETPAFGCPLPQVVQTEVDRPEARKEKR